MIFGLTLTFTTPTWATETCAGGAGTLITGVDGTTQYCMSSKVMNWWSANAWCDALGMKLFNIHTECDRVQGQNKCSQLAQKIPMHIWTQNVPSAETAYYVSPAGDLSRDERHYETHRALCMSQS